MQKATIKAPRGITESNVGKYRKESHFLYGYHLLAPARDKSDKWRPVADVLADLRVYGTNAANYACLWVSAPDFHTSGGGRATGYGYHRPSAAAGLAIQAAGIELAESIDGVGDSAIESALIAIGEALGYKRGRLQLIRSHG